MSSWQKLPYEDNPFADPKEGSGESNKSPFVIADPIPSPTPQWAQDPVPEVPINVLKPDPGTPNQEVPKMILYTRVANLLLSILMIVVSSLSLLTTNNATTGVLACYVVVFSCLLCCFETHLKQISKFIALNFGFMFSAKSRTIFILFVGSILFSFSLFGKIIGCLMLANALFNIYILIKHPEFDEAQRSDAQSEIKDFLSAHPAFAQQFISLGVQSTAAFVASNPDMAQQAVHSYVSPKPPGQPQSSQPSYTNL